MIMIRGLVVVNEKRKRRVGIMIKRPGNIKIRKRKLGRTKVDENVERISKKAEGPHR